jgi:hypothetical protein
MTIDYEGFLEFINMLLTKAEHNIHTWEEVGVNRMADFRKMDPWDAFLYGVASGKKDQLDYLKTLLEARQLDMLHDTEA